MSGFTRQLSMAVLLFVVVPSAAFAQASIAGVVKDTSGAVLPGVTVEAASPVLIEKVRTAVTDGVGEYKIVDLRPGSYTVTFKLTGFNSVKRDGIELTGSSTAAVNADLKVGAVEETITVTGASPIVELQSASKERVLSKDVVDSLPSGRLQSNLGVLVPGAALATASQQDVGGAIGDQNAILVIHGSHQDAQRLTQNGVSIATNQSAGQFLGTSINMGAVQEVQVRINQVSAEQPTGGIGFEFVPRDGGNTFKGSFYGAFANHSMQGNNFTQDLKDRGLTTPDSVKKNWDINPGFGGPIKRDKLWFYGSLKHTGAEANQGSMFYNVNAGNPNAWLYVPDTSAPASNDVTNRDAQLRLAWQATPKNKFGLTYEWQDKCGCPHFQFTSTRAPEASNQRKSPYELILLGDWASPVTNRLLLNVGFVRRVEHWGNYPTPDTNPSMISVMDQGGSIPGLVYRARETYTLTTAPLFRYQASVSYVTGSHALKIGFNDSFGYNNQNVWVNGNVNYRFNNGVPNLITQYATPYDLNRHVDHDSGAFVQDRWTIKALTVTLGARYDHVGTTFPETLLGPGALVPARNITLPATPDLHFNDITPRMGAVYDLFGNGKTAINVSLGKYLAGQSTEGLGANPAPVNTLVLSTTRSWTDSFYPIGDPRRGNFFPDCDLTNPALNGECGKMADPNFGSTKAATAYDPNVLGGWGHRDSNWQFSTGVQHQVLPGVSVDIGYFRRWYNNFLVTDNLTVGPTDYSPFSIPAPADSRLPSGGGYVISGLYDLNTNKFGLPANNYVTFANNFGNQIEHWNGVDVTVNARTSSGVLLQGGLSTGRTTTDNCDVVTKVNNPSAYNCHLNSGFLTQVKLVSTYTVPRVDVLLSGTLQSIPGPPIAANYVASNAVIKPTLGRDLSAGSNQNVTVNLIAPGSLYGERLNQLDLRFGKIFKFGGYRTVVNVDLYNAFNGNAVLTQSDAYPTWQKPLQILMARFVKFGVQLDF